MGKKKTEEVQENLQFDDAAEQTEATPEEQAEALIRAFFKSLDDLTSEVIKFYEDNLAASARRASAVKHLETSIKFARETAVMYGIEPAPAPDAEDSIDGEGS